MCLFFLNVALISRLSPNPPRAHFWITNLLQTFQLAQRLCVWSYKSWELQRSPGLILPTWFLIHDLPIDLGKRVPGFALFDVVSTLCVLHTLQRTEQPSQAQHSYLFNPEVPPPPLSVTRFSTQKNTVSGAPDHRITGFCWFLTWNRWTRDERPLGRAGWVRLFIGPPLSWW